MDNIITADVTSGSQVVASRSVYQYDYGMQLKVIGITDTTAQAHFAIQDLDTALVRFASEIEVPDGSDYVLFKIPNAILQQDKQVTCYVFISDDEAGTTVKKIKINIIPRQSYSDERFTDDQVTQVLNTIKQVQQLDEQTKNAEWKIKTLTQTAAEENGSIQIVDKGASDGVSKRYDLSLPVIPTIEFECTSIGPDISPSVDYSFDDSTRIAKCNLNIPKTEIDGATYMSADYVDECIEGAQEVETGTIPETTLKESITKEVVTAVLTAADIDAATIQQLDTKQDIITDLDTIRSGASIGSSLYDWAKAESKPSYTYSEVGAQKETTVQLITDSIVSLEIPTGESYYKLTGTTSLTVTYPSDGIYCALIDITFGSSPVVSIPADTKLIGDALSPSQGENWQISIRDGVMACAQITES